MTYPVPIEQISSHHIFNLNNFEIRVLSYITNKNVSLKVEGDVIGKLKYALTLKNGAELYSMPVNLPNGEYKIHVYDEDRKICDIWRNFTIGEVYKGKKEEVIHKPRAFLILRFSSIPIIIFLFIIIIPYEFKFGTNKTLENIENYIEGRRSNEMNVLLRYLLIIILSPLISRNRFKKLNKFTRYSIFIVSIYPIIFPIHVFNRINNKIGFAFNVFVVIGSSIQYENWAMEITYSFYLFVLIPSVFYLTGIRYYIRKGKRIKSIYIFNIFFNLFFLLGAIMINFTILAQSTSFKYILIGPYFILLFFVKIIAHIFSYVEKPKRKIDIGEELIEK